MIMSCPSGATKLLTASRSRRFARLRSTALPTALLATNAMRVAEPGRGSVMTVMPSIRLRWPSLKTAARSERLRRRSGADVLPTLGATTLDDTPARPGAHSSPEAVFSGASPIVRLIRAFHAGKNLLRYEVNTRLRSQGCQCKGSNGGETGTCGLETRRIPVARENLFNRSIHTLWVLARRARNENSAPTW